ncbi:MAG: MFS transporter [Armatimonadota bacterium]
MSSATDVRRALPPVYLIFIAALVIDLAVAVIGLGVQLLGNHLGASPSMLGWLGTVGALAYTIGCVFTGTLSDRFGRRLLTSASCVMCGLAWLAMTQAASPLQLLAILPFSGAAISMFWPPVQAWLSEITVGGRERLNRNIGGFNIAWTIGLMVGPVVAGVAWEYGQPVFGPTLPFLIAAGCAASMLILLQAIPRSVPGGGEAAPEDADAVKPHAKVATRFLHLAWIANFASWFGRGLNIVVFTELGTRTGFSASTIGTTISMFLAGQLLMFLYLRNRSGWQYRLWPLAVSLLVSAGAWVLAWFAQSPWVFGLAFAIAGMGSGVTYVSSLYYSLEGHVVSRGARAGIHEAVLGSGVFLGPLLGGQVMEHFGLRAPYMMTAVLFVAFTAVLYVVWLQMRNGLRRAADEAQMEVAGK